jgi:prenyltransferase beta subunit
MRSKEHYDSEKIREIVLNWVRSMQVDPINFKMSAISERSIFASCFALFIYDLFDEVENFSKQRKISWIEYINSFQDEETGYFIPENHSDRSNTKAVQQLTTFCISALKILGATSIYPLNFISQWMSKKNLFDYLKSKGCFKGFPGSGNFAMFVAIFLTNQYETLDDNVALNRLNDWFDFHNSFQNETSGFWGKSIGQKYFSGFQNAFHQFEIYDYWKKDIKHYKKIVDMILLLQDNKGHFSPTPGGGGCFDYDAAAILIKFGHRKNYRVPDIGHALERLMDAILRNQNEDGGFCESKIMPTRMRQVFQPSNLKFILTGRQPYVWYFRLRKTASNSRYSRQDIVNHFYPNGIKRNYSDMWNTWFRCLTIALIDTIVYRFNDCPQWNFQKSIGLGYFDDSLVL